MTSSADERASIQTTQNPVTGPGIGTIAVCALTCMRPVGLGRLLEGLAGILLGEDPPEVRIVIVDNDPTGSARGLVDDAAGRLPFPVSYAVEPRRGIPFARNTALELAGAVDAVVFIDDDEVPEPGWLAELIAVHTSSGAPIVTGPVLPVFEEPPPPWALHGNFFARPRFPTGARLHYARTSNVLIERSVYAGRPRPFPEGLANNGGDDTYFFHEAHLAGRAIVWADDAVVHEWVPPSRVSVRWLMRREFRRGNTLTLVMRALEDSRGRRVRRSLQGVGRVAEGLGLLARSVFAGRHVAVRGLQRIWFGAGLISGLTGYSYQEYAVIHGR
ncbi:MAG: glycosyltransferase family 2 protein [Dehalococcoidia bacterium]